MTRPRFPRSAVYKPFDYESGAVQHVTLALCRRLVLLAGKVARGATDPNVVEEARRIADELRAAARNQYRQRKREANSELTRDRRGRWERAAAAVERRRAA